ncbi:DUF2800 domain-containing protein [Salisediminibacterium selenitireducens]|uniref:DUF2800 domain-containing protein n=1 Tax=Bacillus selenitireducens (strain ATCC 700615 / DSM 15326 / MLS10) TaxID=439292 RepID=D6Y006_BACIE|nr:DUF2800 domain-containing protein [Salisediminibacterium selenitireducens]ADI00508.1 conserved hypothetical protein [[Bacillus] selenitireducens MLS10]
MNHASRAHAKLSASGASRWMNCPPSVKLSEQIEDTTSFYAEEGTFMHELSELYLGHYLETMNEEQYLKEKKERRESPFYTQAIDDAVQAYVDTVIERINEARALQSDALVRIEERVDFSPWVPEGFGTGDVLIVTDGLLEIIDLKGGEGVKVYAEGNPQMRLYALGALNGYGFLYHIDTVQMTIVQPRLDHLSTDEMTADALLEWAETEVKPKAELAFNGLGEFLPGAHCQFCKVSATCRARAEERQKLACLDFKEPPLLTDEEVSQVLREVDELVNWAKQVQEYALKTAMKENKKWPGMKLVQGRGSRVYTDEKAIISTLKEAGMEEHQLFKQTLKPITNMEKMLGKKTFQDLVGHLITKTPGKLKLVETEDSRPAAKPSAAEDFQN